MALVKTRIKQKFETLTQWKTIWDRFTPLEGEIIVFNITTANELSETPYAGSKTTSDLPFTITKTGTGNKTLYALPWDVNKHDHTVSFTYTPEANSISAPSVSITPSTKSISTLASVGSLPEFEAINFKPGSFTNAQYTKGTWTNGSYKAPEYTEPTYTAPSLKLKNEDSEASNIWSDAIYTSSTETLKIGQSSFNAGAYTSGIFVQGSLTFPSYTEPTYKAATYTAPSLTGGTFNPGTLPSKGSETVVVDILDENISVGNPVFNGKQQSFEFKTDKKA